MGSRAKELRRFVEDVLIEEGVVEYEFSVARNAHQQVVFYWKGVRCKYQFPFSPSDYRGMQNSRASLRQAMRAAERHAVPGAPGRIRSGCSWRAAWSTSPRGSRRSRRS